MPQSLTLECGLYGDAQLEGAASLSSAAGKVHTRRSRLEAEVDLGEDTTTICSPGQRSARP